MQKKWKKKYSAYIFTESNVLGLCKVFDKVYRPIPKMKMKYTVHICSPMSIGLHQGLHSTFSSGSLTLVHLFTCGLSVINGQAAVSRCWSVCRQVQPETVRDNAGRGGLVVERPPAVWEDPGSNLTSGSQFFSRQPLRYTALGTGCAPLLQCLGRFSLLPFAGW